MVSAQVVVRPPDEAVPVAPGGSVGAPPLAPRGLPGEFALDQPPPDHLPPASPDAAAVAKVKLHFDRSGLEVHAPFGRRFSIAGRRSAFERLFGQRVVVDDRLNGAVTTEEGGLELSLDQLPGEIRALVASVSFLPPLELPPIPEPEEDP